MDKIVLASGSATRAKLLREAAVAFAVEKPDVDEAALRARMPDASPEAVACALAEAKAEAVATRFADALTIGADQVLAFDGEILGKCETLADARDLLMRMAGKTHTLATATLVMRGSRVLWRHVETVRLTMRAFDDAFLDAYLAAEGTELLYCVGCYRLEGRGIRLFERIEGDYFAVLGLSLLPLLNALHQHGGIA